MEVFLYPLFCVPRGRGGIVLLFISLNKVSSFFLWFGVFQTCFVDCLIEQTHPEIRKRYDQDVSELWACFCLGMCGENVVL